MTIASAVAHLAEALLPELHPDADGALFSLVDTLRSAPAWAAQRKLDTWEARVRQSPAWAEDVEEDPRLELAAEVFDFGRMHLYERPREAQSVPAYGRLRRLFAAHGIEVGPVTAFDLTVWI